ncbi:hypothetical protein Aduo_001840 [Ancylostoma duodenale]
MAMRSAQEGPDHGHGGDHLNGYGGGHYARDHGPPPQYGRNGGYDGYGRGDMVRPYHHGDPPDHGYGRPLERSHHDYGRHDNHHSDSNDWSTSGPNRPIFPSAAQTKNDTGNDFQDGYRGQWSGGPLPPPLMEAHGSPSDYHRSPGPPSNHYYQHDLPPGPLPPPNRSGWAAPPGGPPPPGPSHHAPPPPAGPIPSVRPPHHSLPPPGGPPHPGGPPAGGPPHPGGPPPGSSWYSQQYFPPPFTTSNQSVAPPQQSATSQPPAPAAPFFTMDATARKKLPAWILEGLEKAEREKLKQLEKEERMRIAEEERAKRRALAGKGKFDSSSEDEDEGQADDERSRSKSRQSYGADEDDGEPVFQAKRRGPSVEDLRTEEERKDDAMVAVKFIMMSLLMEVTDEALRSCISETLRESKQEAEPKLLAKSSALAALSSLGGGDESDDDSDDGEDSKGAGKSRAGGAASPSSESSEDTGAFKAPVGVPRKSSKQSTNSSEAASSADVKGDGVGSVKANLRRSGKGGDDVKSVKSGSNGKSSEDSESRRRKRSNSRSRYCTFQF